jgi:hypothetical protein
MFWLYLRAFWDWLCGFSVLEWKIFVVFFFAFLGALGTFVLMLIWLF